MTDRTAEIIFGREVDWENEGLGALVQFRGLTAKQLQTLVDEGLADPEEQQNCAPTTAEFLDFMKDHPGVTAHGYYVGPARDDTRVAIEGLSFDGRVSDELWEEFTTMNRFASNFHANRDGLGCWYD